jgi:O-antigen/teichoic acid export membrane protein
LSLADKVIKNTFYYFISQISGFIIPLFLTPFIISKIGGTQYGVYVLVLGFLGTFGLFDLSISSSFIKFISEYYNKKDYKELNKIINTGFGFYLIFSVIICFMGFIFNKNLLSLINIPDDLRSVSSYALNLSLIIFFISNGFNIFTSVLVSMQRMYISSVLNTFTSILNLVLIIIFLSLGFQLISMIYSQLIISVLSTVITFYYTKKYLPQLKIDLKLITKETLSKMGKFGVQMQVSKLATFASEKYDELLLGFFSVLNNVTFFNISGKVTRLGRFLPSQFIVQIAPIAAELNGKQQKEKLELLFEDAIKYIVLISLPVFSFIFIFADVIIYSWMGKGYEISAYLIRIMATGQLINLCISAPGNSITPNIGIPKYQMYEGLIYLGINLILSFLLIKFYGIVGAAYGSVISTLFASLYVLIVSTRYFNKKLWSIFSNLILKPLFVAVICGIICYLISILVGNIMISYSFIIVSERITGIIILIVFSLIYFFGYALWMYNFRYLNDRDKGLLKKMISKTIPLKRFKQMNVQQW